MSQKVLIFLLLVASSIVSGIDGRRYLFHLPWACAVLYDSSPEPMKLIAACSIFTEKHVLTSVDNFVGRPARGESPYFEQLDKIKITAGSNYMNGTSKEGIPPSVQVNTVDNFYIGEKRRYIYNHFFKGDQWIAHIEKPLTFASLSDVDYDTYGTAYNVGMMLIKPGYKWTMYVRPMTMNFERTGEDAAYNFFTKSLEREYPPKKKCITYSWNERLNRIRYHEVMYLPKRLCLDTFCNWDLLNSETSPNQTYQFCFKSNKYVDVCPNARGAALYCPTFASHSVFAILTSAPSCGQRNMPGVYSTLPLSIRLYERVYSTDFPKLSNFPLEDPFVLEQNNTDYHGIYDYPYD